MKRYMSMLGRKAAAEEGQKDSVRSHGVAGQEREHGYGHKHENDSDHSGREREREHGNGYRDERDHDGDPNLGHEHRRGHGGANGAPAPNGATRGQSKGYVLVAIVYLLGLCMGALDMSIVNPARTVIQNSLGVDDSLGVWIMTIYTLAYAASIPVMGKLADRHGRKYIYLLCIFLFGAGSALCGVAQAVGSFELLIGARVVQALGGGGIMPVATAEFGTAFPEEKRGMALGLVGMVYGLASIFGPSVGSLILDVFGAEQWQFVFYVNIPVCLAVLLIGVKKLPNSTADEVKPIDGLGILLLTLMTLGLMYGLKNIDFFDFVASIAGTDVWPFLVAFAVLLPLFVVREKKAADPVINLSYFRDVNIVITLVCAVISGIIMMGTIFFPQFCENAMLMKSGSGGYFIALLGLGSGVGAMMSGRLIDRHGVKPVLAIGFIGSAIGSLFMALVACEMPNVFTVCGTLLLTGLGLGFTMGTPLNYMMLENTSDEESNSALATLSLVRSIGTAVAPAIMVAFVVHASAGMQGNLMTVMPKEVSVSPLPYAAQIDQRIEELRACKETATMLEGIDIPKLTDYQTIGVNMGETGDGFDAKLSDDMLDKMQNSDVTTIVDTCKDMTAEMFDQIKPRLIQQASDGVAGGITAMEEKIQETQDALDKMGAAASARRVDAEASNGTMADFGAMAQGGEGLSGSLSDIQEAHDSMSETVDQLNDVLIAIPPMFDEAEGNYLTAIDDRADDIQATYQRTLNNGFKGMAFFVAACSVVGLLLLIPYKSKKKEPSGEEEASCPPPSNSRPTCAPTTPATF